MFHLPLFLSFYLFKRLVKEMGVWRPIDKDIVLFLLFKSRALGRCIRHYESKVSRIVSTLLFCGRTRSFIYIRILATSAACFYGYSIGGVQPSHTAAPPADVLHFSTPVALPPPTVFTCLRLRAAVPFQF